MIDQAKQAFLQIDYFERLSSLTEQTVPRWGKMNAQQMVEHVADFFKVSTQKISFPLVTPSEYLFKAREFLLSDKAFRENTKAPVLPEEPFPVKQASLEIAIAELTKEVEAFFTFFQNNPTKTTLHPVFGELNFEEWILLHHKHVTHHFKQFGLL